MKTILIVEDDRSIAKALAVRLQAAGYGVVIARDTLEGVTVAIRSLPDLMVVDVGLPAGGGLVLAERVDKLVTKPTPLIVITASKQPGLRQKAESVGAVGYFEKPYDAQELLARIGEVLRGSPAAAPSSRGEAT